MNVLLSFVKVKRLGHLCSCVAPGAHVHHGQSRGDAEW
uniref:Uncharacterized protein n=1 Tax=Anguilla anguilla TaxID=7936 RepID=A0A0E9XSB9_ANGAN